MHIESITVRVDVRDLEPVSKYSQTSTLASHPDAKLMVQPKYADVSVMIDTDGTLDVDTTIYGSRLTKAGAVDERLNHYEMVIGHFDLELQIGREAVTLLRKLLAETQS